MFSIARSRHTFASQLIFGAVNGAGLVLGAVYNDGTPDLYPGNAHHGLGWAVTAVACAQAAVGVLARLAGAFGERKARTAAHGRPTPVSTEAMAAHQQWPAPFARANNKNSPYRRFSHDSGQGTEPNTESLRSPTFSSSSSSSSRHYRHDEDAALKEEGLLLLPLRHGKDDDDDDGHDESSPALASGSGAAGRAYRAARRAAKAVSSGTWRVLLFCYDAVDRAILVLGSVALGTGVIAQGRLFEGHEIYSGLAHWIKGGVFFWLGLVTLGRWAGAFGDLGWAWNLRPGSGSKKWRPSAEFVESALIFVYGATNIFLEHLGGDGGNATWSAQDLEHVSITVLFIGGGLCGTLVESTAVRDLLNTSVVEADTPQEEEAQEQPAQHGVSLNPIPALVILLLGIMMSSHTQTNMVSSMVHKQWGTLLTGASLARALTYVLMYLKPPRSVLPSRPPTELLAAFGLCAGGIIFMASVSFLVATPFLLLLA